MDAKVVISFLRLPELVPSGCAKNVFGYRIFLNLKFLPADYKDSYVKLRVNYTDLP